MRILPVAETGKKGVHGKCGSSQKSDLCSKGVVKNLERGLEHAV